MTETKRVTTSIKINPDLWKKAKIEAIYQEIDLSELVEDAIQDWIKQEAKRRNK
jgi:hypothetical protein